MMKIEAYQSAGGMVERDIKRAAAWDMHYALKMANNCVEKISFSDCLEIVNRREIIEATFTELDKENDRLDQNA